MIKLYEQKYKVQNILYGEKIDTRYCIEYDGKFYGYFFNISLANKVITGIKEEFYSIIEKPNNISLVKEIEKCN